jgi:tetratricopeptide (TPR) repeat protein
LVATSRFDALVALRKMADAHPSSRNLRTHGMVLAENREYEEATRRLQAALQKDPNNLGSLYLLYFTQSRMGEQDAAVQTARRLVDVENTPYFQTRAIPEVIPVETYRARVFIADQTSEPAEKIRLLEEAIAGFERYRQITYPKLKDLSQGNPAVEYAGDSLKGAIDKMREAQEIGRKLAALYREAGREADAVRVDALVSAFAEAEGSALEK